MPQNHNRSLQQIKQETELTRVGLTDTIEQLRDSITETAGDVRQRIKPDAIKAELSNYVTSKREQILSDITEAAKRNPMQAVAIGAAVAYPLVRIVRSIPIPILMVGAGLYLTGQRGQSLTQSARRLASDQLDRATGAVTGGIDGLTGAAQLRGTNSGATSQELQQSAVGSVSRTAGDLKEAGDRTAGTVTSAAQEFAENASSAARRALTATTDAGLETARSIKEKASDLAQNTNKTVRETLEQNPLAAAGVGLLVGALIATLIPRSRVEDRLVGDSSTAMKKRVQAKASESFEAVKGAAREAYDEAARHAEGLTEGAGKAGQDTGERVRHVTENAVTTAFEPEQDQDQAQNENQRRFTE